MPSDNEIVPNDAKPPKHGFIIKGGPAGPCRFSLSRRARFALRKHEYLAWLTWRRLFSLTGARHSCGAPSLYAESAKRSVELLLSWKMAQATGLSLGCTDCQIGPQVANRRHGHPGHRRG
jgi:hypothetical protein